MCGIAGLMPDINDVNKAKITIKRLNFHLLKVAK